MPVKMKKRKDGRYQKQLPLGRGEDGKMKFTYAYGRTIKEAEENAAEIIANMNKGILPKAKSQTFLNAADAWLKAKTAIVSKPKASDADENEPEAKEEIIKAADVSETTLRWYKGIINKQLKPLHDIKLTDLVYSDLQNILNSLAIEGKSKKTIASVRQVAVSIMEEAVENDIVMRNKFRKAKIPKSVPKPDARQPITEEQRKLILSEKVWKNHRMGVPVLIMYYCGLRRGELIALEWNAVDLEKKELIIRKAATFEHNEATIKDHAKTEAGNRTIRIPADLIEPLTYWKKESKSLYVCPNVKTGSVMSLQAWQCAWNSYQHYLNIAAGGRDASRSNPKVIAVEPFTAHQLRHTYATMLYGAGVDLKTAQAQLGHSDVKVTMGIYTHVDENLKNESLQKLDDYFSRLKEAQ